VKNKFHEGISIGSMSKKMKIIFAALMHESNTFSAKKTTFDMWISADWAENAHKVLEEQTGLVNAHMRHTAMEYDVEIIPKLVALGSGPIITAQCYEEAIKTLLSGIKPCAGEIDGLLLGLHGGASVEGMDDVETDILRRVREVVGYSVPISVPMDLHGNIGEEMVNHCNIIVSCKEYPHTDMIWAIGRAFELLVKTIKGDISPKMAFVKLPMMMPPAKACTMDEPMKGVNTYINEYCKSYRLLDCSFFHGFPYADIPCAGCSVVVTSDGDALAAQVGAKAIALHVWEKRGEFVPMFLSSEEGVAKALESQGGLVIINETSDNPGGGAPCDGTHTLRVLLEKNPVAACFGLISDPETAKAAHAAGEGAMINIKLGAKTDNIHGEPMAVKAIVEKLTDGIFIDNGPISLGIPVDLGLSARLRIGNVIVNVSSKPYQLMGDGFLRLHGVDVKSLRLFCIKSSQHFRAFYQPLASQIITVDPPGIHTSNLAQLSYENLVRPIYPLDLDARFV